jgi:hypothetical protein
MEAQNTDSKIHLESEASPETSEGYPKTFKYAEVW